MLWLDEIVPSVRLVQLGDAKHAPMGEQNRCLLGHGFLPCLRFCRVFNVPATLATTKWNCSARSWSIIPINMFSPSQTRRRRILSCPLVGLPRRGRPAEAITCKKVLSSTASSRSASPRQTSEAITWQEFLSSSIRWRKWDCPHWDIGWLLDNLLRRSVSARLTYVRLPRRGRPAEAITWQEVLSSNGIRLGVSGLSALGHWLVGWITYFEGQSRRETVPSNNHFSRKFCHPTVFAGPGWIVRIGTLASVWITYFEVSLGETDLLMLKTPPHSKA